MGKLSGESLFLPRRVALTGLPPGPEMKLLRIKAGKGGELVEWVTG